MRIRLLLAKRCSGTSLAEKEADIRIREGRGRGPWGGNKEARIEITRFGRIRDKYLEARQNAS